MTSALDFDCPRPVPSVVDLFKGSNDNTVVMFCTLYLLYSFSPISTFKMISATGSDVVGWFSAEFNSSFSGTENKFQH